MQAILDPLRRLKKTGLVKFGKELGAASKSILDGFQLLPMDYLPKPESRYGYGKPAHAELKKNNRAPSRNVS